jgi:hypothetical protein
MKIRKVLQINEEPDASVRKGGTGYVLKAEFKSKELIDKHGLCTVIESFRFEVMLMGPLSESSYLVKMLGYCEDPIGIVMKYYHLNMDHLNNPKFCELAESR